jgi:hypothetical protein
MEGGSFTGDFERQMKVMEKNISRRASLSIGVPLRKLEVSSFARDFKRWMKGAVKVEHFSLRKLCERNLEGGSFTGDPGGCVMEGSGDRPLSS